ncbi:ribosome maturation factor RimP [Motilibacter rhizosphaerae]|uniref:Ribosome maturation factor RimP n=1 Tax=Motilibacter rhizosphaerae TaxID=598652 RepID=A0A4V2F4A8_9ACTN|nr:ribosome maturation factor RimP [Motilibacter rhizosphaerae]RZS86957.1 ribosome maturation factor RimP [Motilibacter rhizosphaerae]
MARAASREALLALLEPVVAGSGCDLEDVEVTPAGRRRLVRVTVDRDGGVPLDVVADVSRAVSDRLDAADPFGETPYVLEVSSPGVGRPLTEPRHWRRAAGRLVEVAVDGAAPQVARVVSADDEAVELEGLGRVAHARLGTGRVQVEFSRPGDDEAGTDELDEGELDDDELDEDGEA